MTAFRRLAAGGRIDRGKGCEELIEYFTSYKEQGGDATLAIGWSGQRHLRRAAQHGVGGFDSVAHGVDIRSAGLEKLVDPNPAPRANLQPGFNRQGVLRPDTDPQHDQLAGQFAAGLQLHGQAVVCGAKCRGRLAGQDLHAVRFERLDDRRGHLGIERRQDLVRQLDQRG